MFERKKIIFPGDFKEKCPVKIHNESVSSHIPIS